MDLLQSAWPIVRRELIGLLRSRRASWVAVLTVVAASVLPLGSWPAPGNPWAPRLASRAFEDCLLAFAGSLLVFVPAVTAGAIAIERERGTFELLDTTRISPAGIVVGKLIANVAFFLLLVALTFPMVDVLFLLGGFEFQEILLSAFLFGGAAVLPGIVGLWTSIRSRRTVRAIMAASGIIIAVPLSLALTFPLSVLVLPVAPFFLVQALLRRARCPDGELPEIGPYTPYVAARREGTLAAHQRSWLTEKLFARARGGIPDR